MKMALFFLVIMVVVAGFVYTQISAKRRAKTFKKIEKSAEPKPQYRCVIINTGLNPCKAARLMALQPILVNEAPVLPLQACNMDHCDCRFTRHNDRRLDDRRDHLKFASQIIRDANNRRVRQDRRKNLYTYET